MKKHVSLLAILALISGTLAGCSGMSEAEANKVDLKAAPKNAPTGGGGVGGTAKEKPGPGASAKPV
jgi:hypothetical protein